jgi:hypothetical protein
MKKLILSSALLVAIILSSSAQPIIDKNDMPQVGVTIRLSITGNAAGINYTLTGTNYTWDFSALSEQSQRMDTFVAVSTTPLAYQLYFNDPFDQPHQATVAQPQPDISIMSYVQFTNVYNYFRAATASYTQVGQGATVNSIPTSIKYDSPDLLYNFPITMGNLDSSYYSYHLQIPTLGYYGESRRRINLVDGWGTVITPYDTFPAMRVLSTSYIHDTIHADSILGGIGFAQDRTEIEYKWLTDTLGLPALKVLKRTGGGGGGGNVSIEYKHKFVVDHTTITEYPYSLTFCDIWPNPATTESQIYFALANAANVEVYISDILGKKLYEVTNKQYSSGFHSETLNGALPLSEGIYLVTIKSGNNFKTLKLQK